MNFNKYIFIFLILISTMINSQNFNDFSFILNEKAINKVFTAVGEISGRNEFEVLMIKGHYNWKMINPKINLKPDSSDFTCDAKVDVGPFNYKTEVLGNVKIEYNNKTNLISIKITKAIFELYTVIMGKKIHIKDIHLEDYLKDPFVFEGPKSFATDMSFTMPDSTVKKIYVMPTQCIMKVIRQAIVTSCEIVASDKPFSMPIKLAPPIQNGNKPKEPSTKK